MIKNYYLFYHYYHFIYFISLKVKHIKRDEDEEKNTIVKEIGTHIDPSKFWEKPLSFSRNGSDSMPFWRKVKKIFLNPDFVSEALSWKGEDEDHYHYRSVVICSQ